MFSLHLLLGNLHNLNEFNLPPANSAALFPAVVLHSSCVFPLTLGIYSDNRLASLCRDSA